MPSRGFVYFFIKSSILKLYYKYLFHLQIEFFSAFDESFCDFLEDSTPYAFVSGVVMVVWICAFVQINFSSFHPKIFF